MWKHKYINEKENEFIVFICKNVPKKAFHSQKMSFKVAMFIQIAEMNPANVLISSWFEKINLAKHNFFLLLIRKNKSCSSLSESN